MASDSGAIVYVAVIGEQRELIVSRSFGHANEAQLQLSAYAAMDIIQEKSKSISYSPVIQHYSATPGVASDPYLGFITPTLVGEEFYKVHAYMAATGFSIIAIFDEQEAPASAIRTLFERIHILFANTMCNPLMSMKFQSPRFIAELDKIAIDFIRSQ